MSNYVGKDKMNNRTFKSLMDTLGMFIVGVGGFCLGSYLSSPRQVITGDFNKDSYPDMALYTRHGIRPLAIFLGQKDGKLELTTDLELKMTEEIEAQIKMFRSQLETNLKPEDSTQGLEGK